MSHLRRTAVAGLLLLGAAGCVDLDVKNPNDPDRAQALQSANDVESLIGGSFNSWFDASHTYYLLPFSTSSFQHSAPWANFGMVPLSTLPRSTWVNDSADPYYSAYEIAWTRSYRALAAVADGLRSIEDASNGIAEELGDERVVRAKAWGRFIQGLSLGEIALLYDQGFVADETVDPLQPQEAQSAAQLMEKAVSYFQEAAELSSGASFTIPNTWAPQPDDGGIPSDKLAQLARSYAAVWRASVARTPEEAASVDWNAVLADIDAGVDETFRVYADWDVMYNSFLDYGTYDNWQQLNYMIEGMADQSGNYQLWLSTPIASRQPTIGDQKIVIITPDKRFPQGSTIEEQRENPGTLWSAPEDAGHFWARPDRGTWRWSWYHSTKYEAYNNGDDFNVPILTAEEMKLLAAEAKYWLGDKAGAAALVNETRTAAGLNATDASGTNTSCVPKLPSGSCGDLLEMLKWEKRQETWMVGAALGLSWYFDGRRWGDLYKGTPLEVSIPCQEIQVLQMPQCVSTGGVGGTAASEGSSYAFPNES